VRSKFRRKFIGTWGGDKGRKGRNGAQGFQISEGNHLKRHLVRNGSTCCDPICSFVRIVRLSSLSLAISTRPNAFEQVLQRNTGRTVLWASTYNLQLPLYLLGTVFSSFLHLKFISSPMYFIHLSHRRMASSHWHLDCPLGGIQFDKRVQNHSKYFSQTERASRL
jgi:hypothetical protein